MSADTKTKPLGVELAESIALLEKEKEEIFGNAKDKGLTEDNKKRIGEIKTDIANKLDLQVSVSQSEADDKATKESLEEISKNLDANEMAQETEKEQKQFTDVLNEIQNGGTMRFEATEVKGGERPGISTEVSEDKDVFTFKSTAFVPDPTGLDGITASRAIKKQFIIQTDTTDADKFYTSELFSEIFSDEQPVAPMLNSNFIRLVPSESIEEVKLGVLIDRGDHPVTAEGGTIPFADPSLDGDLLKSDYVGTIHKVSRQFLKRTGQGEMQGLLIDAISRAITRSWNKDLTTTATTGFLAKLASGGSHNVISESASDDGVYEILDDIVGAKGYVDDDFGSVGSYMMNSRSLSALRTAKTAANVQNNYFLSPNTDPLAYQFKERGIRGFIDDFPVYANRDMAKGVVGGSTIATFADMKMWVTRVGAIEVQVLTEKYTEKNQIGLKIGGWVGGALRITGTGATEGTPGVVVNISSV